MVKSVKYLSLIFAAALLFACGEQAQVVNLGPVSMPADHNTAANPPPVESQSARQVIVPKALQGKYQSATMAVQLPDMTESISITLPLSGEPLQTEYGTLLVRDYLPDFLISGNTITSEGLEEKNPALWAEWQRDGQIIFAGWVFHDYPSLNPMLVPEHQLTFISVK